MATNVKLGEYEDTTANIEAVKRARRLQYDTDKDCWSYYKADGTTLRHLLTLDDVMATTYAVKSLLMTNVGWIGYGAALARIQFAATTLSLYTFKLGIGGVPSKELDVTGDIAYSGAIYEGATSRSAQWNLAYALKVNLDARNGIIACDGAGNYSTVVNSSTNWDSAYTNRVETWSFPLSKSTTTVSLLYDSTTLGVDGSNQLYAKVGGLAHNSLASLQGGTAAEYYHLTAANYGFIDQDVKANSSPAFANVTAATQAADNNTTRVATTAWVLGQLSSSNPVMNGVAAAGVSTRASRYDHVHASDTSREATISAGTTGQYWRGDKSWQTLDKTAVGLANVENTALSTWAGSANIITLGTVTTGVWTGTAIGTAKGGTALTSIGTANQLLCVNNGATGLEYKTLSGSCGIVVTLGGGSAAITIGSILTSDWDIGAGRYIAGDKFQARSASGLSLFEAGGSGIFIKNGGDIGVGTISPLGKFDIAKSAASADLYLSCWSTLATDTPVIVGLHSKNASIGTLTVTDVDTNLLTLTGSAVNSSGAQRNVASIKIVQDDAAGVTYVAGRIEFWTGTSLATQAKKMMLDKSGYLTVGTLATSPDSLLHVWNATAGTVTAQTYTMATIENNNNAYLSFLTPNNKISGMLFGDADNNDVGWINYDHANTNMTFGVEAATKMIIAANGAVSISTAAAAAYTYTMLDVQSPYSAGYFASQLHLHTASNATGMFLGAFGTGGAAHISSGAPYYSDGTHIARATTASGIELQAASGIAFQVWCNIGLTPDATFTPTQRLIVLADGKTGIGVTPSYLFHIKGSAADETVAYFVNSNNDGVDITTNTSDASVGFYMDSTHKGKFQYDYTNNKFNFECNGTVYASLNNTFLSIPANNSIIIGLLTDDASKYGVYGFQQYDSGTETEGFVGVYGLADATTNKIFIGGGASGWNASTSIEFYTAANAATRTGTQRMIILNDGKVGIGSIPSFLLDITDTAIASYSTTGLPVATVRIFKYNNSTSGLEYTALNFTCSDTTAGAYAHGAISLLQTTSGNAAADFAFTLRNLAGSYNEIMRIRSTSRLSVAGDLDITSTGAFYFGDPNTNGTYKIVRSGNDLIIQRRETGSYVTKSTIMA